MFARELLSSNLTGDPVLRLSRDNPHTVYILSLYDWTLCITSLTHRCGPRITGRHRGEPRDARKRVSLVPACGRTTKSLSSRLASSRALIAAMARYRRSCSTPGVPGLTYSPWRGSRRAPVARGIGYSNVSAERQKKR